MREKILAVARRLTLEAGVVPSLNAVVAAAGVSKGGLVHHFPTRTALVAGLARAALEEVDDAMSEAATRGDAAETWLRLSLPDSTERALMQALAAGLPWGDTEATLLLEEARLAVGRWEQMIADDVRDPVRARVIRLVGDALVANAVAGLETEPTGVDELIGHLCGPSR